MAEEHELLTPHSYPLVIVRRRVRAAHEGITIAYAPVKTLTNRDFVRNVSAAKHTALQGVHVIVADRGKPILALIAIADYRHLTKAGRNLAEMLRMPEADAIEADFEPVRICAQDINA